MLEFMEHNASQSVISFFNVSNNFKEWAKEICRRKKLIDAALDDSNFIVEAEIVVLVLRF